MAKHCFVGLPKNKMGKVQKTSLYEMSPAGKMSAVRQVLWGDWLHIATNDPGPPAPNGYLKVEWKPNSPNSRILFIKKEHTSDFRPLEMDFVDVGQGDGAVLITPERNEREAIMIIDAGKKDHMHRFLNERFKTYVKRFQFHAAIISHPDDDHYLGFKSIFSSPFIGFDHIYQSGLVERPVSTRTQKSWSRVKKRKTLFGKLGKLVKSNSTGIEYIQGLIGNRTELSEIFTDEDTVSSYSYPQTIFEALKNPRIKKFGRLGTDAGKKEDGRRWLPGFAPSDKREVGNTSYSIEVLGPVVEKDAEGNRQLRVFGSPGKTKNGHSIILMLHIGKFRVLFGGDLNVESERFLMAHYGGSKNAVWPKDFTLSKEMRAKLRRNFGADIMKACHHGASDVTDEFLSVVNPAGFVISSGDNEGHVHPRPDLLGRLGKQGRTDSPVILSTELQRSMREKADEDLLKKIKKKITSIDGKLADTEMEEIYGELELLGRSEVGVFGTIYLKTDGNTLLTAFKKESGSDKKKWFTFQYDILKNGNLSLQHIFY